MPAGKPRGEMFLRAFETTKIVRVPRTMDTHVYMYTNAHANVYRENIFLPDSFVFDSNRTQSEKSKCYIWRVLLQLSTVDSLWFRELGMSGCNSRWSNNTGNPIMDVNNILALRILNFILISEKKKLLRAIYSLFYNLLKSTLKSIISHMLEIIFILFYIIFIIKAKY